MPGKWRPVEHVTFETWLLYTRVIEVPFQIPPHPDSFHNPDRPNISRRCEGENLWQRQFLKSHNENSGRRFRRQPTSPKGSGQPPENLHAGREVRLKVRDRQAYDAR